MSIRLDGNIVDYYRAKGSGWQGFLNADLAFCVEQRRGFESMKAQERAEWDEYHAQKAARRRGGK